MKIPRNKLISAALGLSIALNLAFLVDHARRGTLRRIFTRLDLVEAPADRSAYQDSMESRYRKLQDRPGGIVFAGDSLIFQGPWSEFYSDIHNRGIPNETSALLLGRLGVITRGKPRKVILLTGANDFIQGVPISQLIKNCRSILETIRAESPRTEVAMIGLLPVNPSLPVASRQDNASRVEANRQLLSLTLEFPGTRFLDLTRWLVDESGKLRREFTSDGLHLTLEGYLAVREAVQGLVDDPGGSTADVTRSPLPSDHRPDLR